jgi:hypothetical protein
MRQRMLNSSKIHLRGSGLVDERFPLIGGQFAFGALQLRCQFFAHDGQLGRRLDADAHTAMPDLYDRDGDLIADKYSLADFSTQNEHVLGLAGS